MRKVALWLSFVMLFTVSWETAVELKGLGSLGRISGLGVAAFWIATIIITKKIRKPHLFHIFFSLFVLWHILSVFWTIDLDKTLGRLETYVQLFGLIYIIWDLYRTPQAINSGLQAYVLGVWVSIGGLLFNFVNNIRFTYSRYSAFNFDENNLGVIIAIGIPIAWYLAILKRQTKLDTFLSISNFIYIPIALFSITLTGSRGSLITASIGFMYILTSSRHLKPITWVFVLIVLSAIFYMVLPYIPPALIQRLTTTEQSIAGGDLNGRVNIWQEGLDTFADHPLLGVGSSAFSSSVEVRKEAHNSYLVVLVELGLVGFGLLAFMLAITAYHGLIQPKDVRLFWLSLLLVLATGIFSLNWAHRKQTWIFPMLAIANACLPAQQADPKRLFLSSSRVPQRAL